MSDTWTISVAGRNYGPYRTDQMQAFVAEGRVVAQSLVLRAGESQFRPAGEEPLLAPLFAQGAAARAEPEALHQLAKTPQFFTAEGNEEIQTFGRSEDDQGSRAHFIVVADMKSRSISGLEEEIFNIGPALPILPQAWLLSTDMSINAIRQTLVQKLGKLDMLFIADATHDKAAWFNFGPEADSRIRRIWQKAPEIAAAPKRAAG